MQQHDLSDPLIPIRITVWESIAAYERLRAAAMHQHATAQTPDDRLEALIWIDNAERNLARCQRQLERGMV